MPVVEAGARHAERPAQAGDGLALTLLVDQPVQAHRRSVSRAKKVTARFRISRSCSSSRTCRRSLRSSSRSSVVSPSSRSPRSSWSCLSQIRSDSAADAQLAGDLTHRAAADLDQADRLTPELRRVGPLIPLWHDAPPSSPSATLTKRSDVRRNGGGSNRGSPRARISTDRGQIVGWCGGRHEWAKKRAVLWTWQPVK